ncbi:helix-turn-helix domain-containing protein [Xanthomonas sp. WHRI 1810A]|uniref:helix-turn-helix domain-containing protein n=1 Tax=Xanthomonas sp. WHRI 1810A TaxID=3161565 RepID=UPI0032E860E2
MSFQAMAWAVEQKLPTREKFVLLMLANRTNHDTGRCDPSHRRLAEDCGMSPSTVKRAIQQLQDDGYLVIENRAFNAVKLPNQYRLCLERGVGSQRTYPVQDEPTVGSHGPEGSGQGDLRVGSHRPIKQESNQEDKTGSKTEKPCGDLSATQAKASAVSKASKTDSGDVDRQEACRAIWSAYATAYFQRYNTEPVRNAKINSQVNDLLKRLGSAEAPQVAAYYLVINDGYLIRSCHDFGSLLAKAEAYRTQWATNTQMNSVTARQMESTQANRNSADQAKAMIIEGGQSNAFLRR